MADYRANFTHINEKNFPLKKVKDTKKKGSWKDEL